MSPEMEQISRWPLKQRMALLEELWESVAADPGVDDLTDWHQEIPGERIADYERNPNDVVDWSALRESLQDHRK